MKTLLFVTVLLGITACANLQEQLAFNPRYREPVTPQDNRTDVEICEDELKTTPEIPKCDLEVYNNLKERKPVIDACLKQGKKSDECGKVYSDMVYSRITLKYPYANWGYADTWCKSEPLLCDNTLTGFGRYEEQLKESHRYNRSVKRQTERQAEESARLDRAMKINAIMNSYRPTNCTSTRIGNTVSTNCY